MTAPPPAHLPRALGRYRIQSEVGRGSMGVVYKAEDPVLGRQVALKVIQVAAPVGDQEQQILEQRFLREASLAASLSHPGIVTVLDVGRDPEAGTSFIALEYLEGRTLDTLLARGQALDWRAALRMTARLAAALQHAHAQGVVHRDVKPSNIMMLPSGQAKILDFGVARVSNAHLTNPGEVWGTPHYMSPEQASGQRVDGRSDLFSLGAVLYELVTGRRAFDGEGVTQVLHSLLQDDPPPPSFVNPVLPPALDILVARALAKDPDERYPDGRAFREDIEDVLHARPLRERGLATPPESGALLARASARVVDPSPPTLTTRTPTARWRRLSRRASRVLNLTLGAALGIGAVAIVFGAGTGTIASTTLPAASGSPAPAALLEPGGSLPAIPSPSPSAPAPAPARVAIALEHGFKEGRVRVWVDDEVVLDEPLSPAASSRSLLVFKKRKGTFAEVLDVAPGERTLRFEVEGDGETRAGLLRGRMRSDQTRLLVVKAGGKLSLEWKS